MRRTKIIATLGPAVASEDRMVELVKAGCDVARLNVAHGTIREHRTLLRRFRRASQRAGKITGVMLDIKGPEIRISRSKKRFLREGEELTISPGGDLEFNHEEVYDVLEPGDVVLIHDGEIRMEIVERKKDSLVARVQVGGIIGPHMGVNVPGKHVPLEYLQERDMEFMRSLRDVDFIAASFVRSASDVISLRKFMREEGMNAMIIAKIENQEGVDRIDEILEVSDGIMVARGDLGTEIPVENLPGVQKELLRKARIHGKPGIIATQILESMIRNPQPTRAEVSDIANAILDGADALMLSGETAIGKHPIEAVRILSRVAERADRMVVKEGLVELKGGIPECVGNAAVLLAEEIDADSILLLTRSGKTARLVSRHRIPTPILAAAYSPEVLRSLTLYWGVQGFRIRKFRHADNAVKIAVREAERMNLVKRGNLLVVAGGEPSGAPGTTNFVWVQLVGKVIARGSGYGRKVVRGRACREDGCDILIVEELLSAKIPRVKGVVVESRVYEPSVLEELASRGISVVAGTGKIDVEGEITLDPARGLVWM